MQKEHKDVSGLKRKQEENTEENVLGRVLEIWVSAVGFLRGVYILQENISTGHFYRENQGEYKYMKSTSKSNIENYMQKGVKNKYTGFNMKILRDGELYWKSTEVQVLGKYL